MKKHFKLTSIITFLFILVLNNLLAQSKPDKIDDLINKYVEYKLFTGSVLVADDGNVIFSKGYGYANIEWDIPNTPDTKFRLGSVTKQFTSMLIMQLVEQGKISLDNKLSDFIPEYRKDIGEKVTIHHLLTHTSGIPSYTNDPNFIEEVSRDPYEPLDFILNFCSNDLEFEPGGEFNYNNSGYFILGHIIERVTGLTYEEALQKNIFTPLGMNNSGYDHSEKILKKRASGYESNSLNYLNADFLDMSLPYAAGSLYSTVEDLFKWDRAIDGYKLLNEENTKIMFTPFLSSYAYGWGVQRTMVNNDSLTLIAHGGGINGFNTIITRIPEKDQVIILINNTSSAPLNKMTRAIMDILYDQDYEYPKKPISQFLYETLETDGIEAVEEIYYRTKNEDSNIFEFTERDLNHLGYFLLSENKITEALVIFQLNIDEYPNSYNVYDSMGEALMINGQKDKAIMHYQKSIELNPNNTNAYEKLNKLGVDIEKPEKPLLSNDVLVKHVGKYQLAENFILDVTVEGTKIFVQATGQAKIEIVPSTETKFYIDQIDANIEFVKDESDNTTALILHQSGQEFNCIKVE